MATQLYTTETHRISCFDRDEQERPRRELIHDIAPVVQIFESSAEPGIYIFLREEENPDYSMASTLYAWAEQDPAHPLPAFEIREKGALLNASPIAAFIHGDVYGSSVQEIELKLKGHLVRENYHAWDCNCPWCSGTPMTGTDERGPYWAYWEPPVDVPGPILIAGRIEDRDQIIAGGVQITEIDAIDPCSGEAQPFIRLELPSGTKLALNGGWPHFQLPNRLEIWHKVTRHYDEVEGDTTGSSSVGKVESWHCRWLDSLNRNEQPVTVSQAFEDDNHPF